jgi:hypothetical protein
MCFNNCHKALLMQPAAQRASQTAQRASGGLLFDSDSPDTAIYQDSVLFIIIVMINSISLFYHRQSTEDVFCFGQI